MPFMVTYLESLFSVEVKVIVSKELLLAVLVELLDTKFISLL
jgi:hypothetical protein